MYEDFDKVLEEAFGSAYDYGPVLEYYIDKKLTFFEIFKHSTAYLYTNSAITNYISNIKKCETIDEKRRLYNKELAKTKEFLNKNEKTIEKYKKHPGKLPETEKEFEKENMIKSYQRDPLYLLAAGLGPYGGSLLMQLLYYRKDNIVAKYMYEKWLKTEGKKMIK